MPRTFVGKNDWIKEHPKSVISTRSISASAKHAATESENTPKRKSRLRVSDRASEFETQGRPKGPGIVIIGPCITQRTEIDGPHEVMIICQVLGPQFQLRIGTSN